MSLNVNHKAAIAKAVMSINTTLDGMTDRNQVEAFANELLRRIQSQCVNKLMAIDGVFLEQLPLDEEPEQKEENAIQSPESS